MAWKYGDWDCSQEIWWMVFLCKLLEQLMYRISYPGLWRIFAAVLFYVKSRFHPSFELRWFLSRWFRNPLERTTKIAFIKQSNVKNWLESYQWLKVFKFEDQKKTRLQCWLSRVQQVSHQRWIIACMQGSAWLWNPGHTWPKVQNMGISGPTKRTDVLQFKKKRVLKNWLRDYIETT